MSSSAALELFARSPRIHLFVSGGAPSATSVCPALVHGALVFAAPPDSNVLEGTPVLAVASEHIASIPRGFGGGALGLEVRARGHLVKVDDPALQEAATQLGARPVGLAMGTERWLQLDRMEIEGTAQLAQERPPLERVALLQALWDRGLPEDPRAIDLIRRASPRTAPPPFLEAPTGVQLCCAMEPSAEREAIALLEQTWQVELSSQSWGEAHRHSSAWVGARDDAGNLIATARAVSDWSRDAWIYDVMVAAGWRNRGVGRALVGLLLEHPALRQVKRIRLRSSDRAQSLYTDFGFRAVGPPSPSGTIEMCRLRAG